MQGQWRADETLHACAHSVTQWPAPFSLALLVRDHNAKGHVMEITTTIDEHGVATLKATIMNSSTVLHIPEADGLADDLEAALNVGHLDTYHDEYTVLVQPDGLIVKVRNGAFNIPWQHITAVVAQLRA